MTSCYAEPLTLPSPATGEGFEAKFYFGRLLANRCYWITNGAPALVNCEKL